MENVPHQLTEQIWHRLIGLQYANGDFAELRELKSLTKDEFVSVIRYLLGHRYIRTYNANRPQHPNYYVTDASNLCGVPDVNYYLPERNFSGTILKKYINNALSSLSELITNPIPLDPQTNPPGIKVDLVKESSRLRELSKRIQSKVLVDTMEDEKNEDKDGDRDKFRFKFGKEDGSNVIFIAQFSGTWRASNHSITDSGILEIIGSKIKKYVHESEDVLPGVIYSLRCVCATSSYGEDGIQLDSLEEVDAIPMTELIYKYE